MNKSLYCFVTAALIVISFVCLSIGSINNRPTQFIAILVADIMLSSLFYTIVGNKGVGIKEYFKSLVFAVICVLLMALFSIFFRMLVYPLIWGPEIAAVPTMSKTQLFVDELVHGIRITSLFLPFLYLIYAAREKTKTIKIIPEEKKKKKEPKAEQKL